MTDYQGDGLKTTCLCGVHVHKGTKIVLWLNVVFTALYILGLFIGLVIVLSSPENQVRNEQYASAVKLTRSGLILQFIFNIIGSLVGLAPSFMVLYGLKTKRSGFYWPYLIIVGIAIVMVSVYVVISTFLSIAAAIGLVATSVAGEHSSLLAGGILGLNAVLVFVVIASIYFNFIIVNRSRKLLEFELYHPIAPAYNQVPPAYNPHV